MTKKAKHANTVVKEERSPIINLISGVGIAYAITCIIFIGYALLLTYTSVSESNMQIIIIITMIISVSVAGFDAARGVKDRGWLWGMIAGAIYSVVLLIIMAIVTKKFAFNGSVITILIISVAGGSLGGMFGINTKKV